MKAAYRSAVLLAASLGLGALVSAGCSSTPKAEPTGDIVSSPTTPAAQDDSTKSGGDLASQGLKTVYFDFDSYVLTPDTRSLLTSGAEALKTKTGTKIQIEGHCDERGSNEYNLALGEKRARAVEEFLISQGVSKDQLSTISYGEERPAVPGNDEAAWEKNRRAEFVGL